MLSNSRWVVIEEYYGKFETTEAICFCPSLYKASVIIDAMVKVNCGRPFIYRAEKRANDYIDVVDGVTDIDFITGETKDYSVYINGVWA